MAAVGKMKRAITLLLIVLSPASLAGQARGPAPSPTLVFRHVTVIDVAGGPARPGMTVVVRGHLISAVGQDGKVRVPAGAQVVDAAGKFVIPGLWDMHVHLSAEKTPFPLFVANGVLGVRHMGGNLRQVYEWREAVRRGRLLGPRIVACGSVVDEKTEEDTIGALTAAEGRRAVLINQRQGADFIKVYDGVSREAYFALAAEARRRRITFAGHTPLAVTSFEVSDAGQRSIEHLGNILGSSSTLPADEIERRVDALVKPSGTPGDFSHIPARIAERTKIELATYDARKAERLFARFVRNRTWQVPTLEVKRVLSFVDDGSFYDDPRMKYIPEAELEGWKPENQIFLKFRTPEYVRVKKLLYEKEFDLVLRMHKAGVPFLLGTDVPAPYAYTGFTVHDELALFVRAGFTPLAALQSATINPAKFLGLLKSLGTVEAGKAADLVLLDANPLDDITNTKRVWAVVAGGRYLSKESLEEMLRGEERR